MKKNVMMRAAGGLLVAVMLTTSVVSGTYAKYVTSDSGNDTARVAKFGVVVQVSGDLFGKSYVKGGTNSIQAWTAANVESVTASANTDKVVAPGTKNDTGMTIGVTGTPEVSTALTVSKMKDKTTGNNYVNSNIELVQGEYGVMVPVTVTVTTDNVTNYYKKTDATFVKATASDTSVSPLYELKDVANLSANYLPIDWHVARTQNGSTTTSDYTNVADLYTAVNALTTANSVPNTDLATTIGNVKITWDWDFEDGTKETNTNTDIYANDRFDTILGDMIAAQQTNGATWYVVKKNDNKYDEVKYQENVNVATNSADKAIVAYTGETAPSTVYTDGSAYTTSEGICGVLTVNFAADIAVVQVD